MEHEPGLCFMLLKWSSTAFEILGWWVLCNVGTFELWNVFSINKISVCIGSLSFVNNGAVVQRPDDVCLVCWWAGFISSVMLSLQVLPVFFNDLLCHTCQMVLWGVWLRNFPSYLCGMWSNTPHPRLQHTQESFQCSKVLPNFSN